MLRIGVVGPRLSVERILKLAREIEHDMEFVPYSYKETKEVEKIILKYDQQVDFWFFSGPIPYKIARKTPVSKEKLVYIFSVEASIYKGIMELAYSQGQILQRVSMDMVLSDDYTDEESLQRLKTVIKEFYVKSFDTDIDPEKLFLFHYGLWKAQKIDGALTCYPTVYEALKEKGIPAYWISPTLAEINHAVRIFTEKIKTSYYKDTQIGVEMIEVIDFYKIKVKMKKPYKIQYLEIRLKEILLQLCEKIDGSLTEQGNGRFLIISSRGVIEREIQTLQEILQQLSLEANATVAVGIGFGQTVYTAEINAYQALLHSKEKEEQKISIVQDDGTIIEGAGEDLELSYSYRTEDKEILEKLKQGNISVKTYNKLKALIRKMGRSSFTAKDLAVHLQMSERNAQRITADLCKVNLADCVGEELHHTRGRPIKVYQLK